MVILVCSFELPRKCGKKWTHNLKEKVFVRNDHMLNHCALECDKIACYWLNWVRKNPDWSTVRRALMTSPGCKGAVALGKLRWRNFYKLSYTMRTRVAQNLQKLKKELFTYGIWFLNMLKAQNDKAQLSSFAVHMARSNSFLGKMQWLLIFWRFHNIQLLR